jgi:hypothetical protein
MWLCIAHYAQKDLAWEATDLTGLACGLDRVMAHRKLHCFRRIELLPCSFRERHETSDQYVQVGEVLTAVHFA